MKRDTAFTFRVGSELSTAETNPVRWVAALQLCSARVAESCTPPPVCHHTCRLATLPVSNSDGGEGGGTHASVLILAEIDERRPVAHLYGQRRHGSGPREAAHLKANVH